MLLTNLYLVQRVRLGKVIGNYYTSLASGDTMPRKRTSPRTKKDNTKVQKVSLSYEDETQSPYFPRADGGSEARGSQEEKQKGGLKAKKSSLTLPDPPITLPEPLVSLSPPAPTWGPGRRLTQHFYDQECITLAKALLGKT